MGPDLAMITSHRSSHHVVRLTILLAQRIESGTVGGITQFDALLNSLVLHQKNAARDCSRGLFPEKKLDSGILKPLGK